MPCLRVSGPINDKFVLQLSKSVYLLKIKNTVIFEWRWLVFDATIFIDTNKPCGYSFLSKKRYNIFHIFEPCGALLVLIFLKQFRFFTIEVIQRFIGRHTIYYLCSLVNMPKQLDFRMLFARFLTKLFVFITPQQQILHGE